MDSILSWNICHFLTDLRHESVIGGACDSLVGLVRCGVECLCVCCFCVIKEEKGRAKEERCQIN